MKSAERLKELDLEIRSLTLDLLGPIAAKVIVDKAYNRFFDILDEIKDILEYEEYAPKSLMKILIYIYLTVEADASHADTDTKLFMTYATLNGKILYLLGDEPLR